MTEWVVRNPDNSLSPRLLALYLPQFYPNPENNLWWGEGYTEWTNVARAQPAFPGHYQPQLPADLGFYDLRLPESRKAQAELAKAHGIHGFCYYHYWFNGRRVLERPFEEVLDSGEPDFPFCLSWANHTWTWKRDHNLQGRLMEQEYSEEDDKAHIQWLLRAFQDERYIRVKGRPLMLIYWTSSLPNPERTFEIWRDEAEKAGEAAPYICKMDTFGDFEDPREFGCDAATEFWPHSIETMTRRTRAPYQGYEDNKIFDYSQLVSGHLNRLKRTENDFNRFPCVVPRWDNTARWKAEGATVLADSSPELYRGWLSETIEYTANNFEPEEQLIFINAWNEWGEGAYLEPDIKYGRGYLEATREALRDNGFEVTVSEGSPSAAPESASAEDRYEKLLEKYNDLLEQLAHYMSEEEYSPLLKRAEQNYQQLHGKHQKLAAENRQLQGYYNHLEKRFESLKANTGVSASDPEFLILLQQLEENVTVLLNSRRWQLADRMLKTAERVQGKDARPTVEDALRANLKKLKRWTGKK